MLLSIKTYQYYVISPDTINVGSVSMLQPVNGIIDVHAHIIPKADDGSRYLGETRFMLKEAYAQGIRSVIATPHYLHRHNKMSAGQILDALEKVKKNGRRNCPGFNNLFRRRTILPRWYCGSAAVRKGLIAAMSLR